jgi:hypothetical protein
MRENIWCRLINHDNLLQVALSSKYGVHMDVSQMQQRVIALSESLQQHKFEYSEPMIDERSARHKFSTSHIGLALFKYQFEDYLVHRQLYTLMTEVFQQSCSPFLYSFMKGRSNHQAVRSFRKYLSKNIMVSTDVIGLVQIDIKTYTKSIFNHNNKILWRKLESLLGQAECHSEHCEYFRYLLFSPYELVMHKSNILRKSPCGSPLLTLASNLYLSSVDDECQLEFYSRFGDDILCADQSINKLSQYYQFCEDECSRLNIKLHAEKTNKLYFSKSGGVESLCGNYAAANSIHFLGYIVHANGDMQPSRKMRRVFIKRCKDIVNTIAYQYRFSTIEEQGLMICCELNNNILFLDFESLDARSQNANLVLRCNVAEYLLELDRRLALLIAEKLSSISGLRAFRKISYAKIRADWSLKSLHVLYSEYKKVKDND